MQHNKDRLCSITKIDYDQKPHPSPSRMMFISPQMGSTRPMVALSSTISTPSITLSSVSCLPLVDTTAMYRLPGVVVFSSFTACKSINQISIAPISPARLSGMTGESVINSKIDETVPQHQWVIRPRGNSQAKGKCLEKFLGGSN